MSNEEIIEAFHCMFYEPSHGTSYLGRPLWKSPLDLFVYQEVINTVRPSLIIETGTGSGASALFFAHFMDNARIDGRIATLDLAEGRSFEGVYLAGDFIYLGDPVQLPEHERITYHRGMSSVDPRAVRWVDSQVRITDSERRSGANGSPDIGKDPSPQPPVMVILDSEHARPHVLGELEAYAGFVSPGSYLVVEDVNVNGHPVYSGHGPGPFEAVKEWLPNHPEFEVTRPWEKYLLTFHAWLRRR